MQGEPVFPLPVLKAWAKMHEYRPQQLKSGSLTGVVARTLALHKFLTDLRLEEKITNWLSPLQTQAGYVPFVRGEPRRILSTWRGDVHVRSVSPRAPEERELLSVRR